MGRSGGRSGGFGGRGFSGGFRGGGRSSGSFRGGSRGRSGGSASRSPGGGYTGGFFGGFRGPIFIHTTRNYGGGSGSPPGGPSDEQRQLDRYITKAVIVFLVLVLMLLLIIWFCAFVSDGEDVAKSTVEREPLPAGAVVETGYYTDEPGWITNSNTLLTGLRNFYRRTGVQPYLYIAETVNGSRTPFASEITQYAETLYDQLFTDEAHFLLVFCDDGVGSYTCGYAMGTQVKTIMDEEAIGILADYLDRYYYSDLSDDQFFSTVFDQTSERIMTVTKSPWPTVIVVIVLGGLAVLLFIWWKKAKEQKNLEAKQTEELLQTPLEKFGDTEVEELAKKYQDMGDSQT